MSSSISRASSERINPREFRGLHQGKRLFILSSGPSLGELDLTRLRRRLVMGLNRSFLAYPEPHYHCVMDQRLFEEFGKELSVARFLFTLADRPLGIPLRLLGGEGFSDDLENGIYTGYTISYFALQVAAYMGFSEIYYLGLDLRHRSGDTHFFGRDFRNRDHENTEFPKMRKVFERAAPLLLARGIQVFNCSPVSTLECFPYRSYEDAVSL